MKIVDAGLGCKLVEPQAFGDSRGTFYESWNQRRWADQGLDLNFVQSNVSRSQRGVLRGLHYQWPQAQGKLVMVLEGEVQDVRGSLLNQSPSEPFILSQRDSPDQNQNKLAENLCCP